MSYEINIIAINQSTPIHWKGRSSILLHNELENEEVNRYVDIWPFFSNMQGVQYSVVEEINPRYYSAAKVCDSNFEYEIPGNMLFDWMQGEDLTPCMVRADLQDDVFSIIECILNSSPSKRILFQTRYQGKDREVVLGVIKINEFRDMFYKNQLLFNVCYIVEED